MRMATRDMPQAGKPKKKAPVVAAQAIFPSRDMWCILLTTDKDDHDA